MDDILADIPLFKLLDHANVRSLSLNGLNEHQPPYNVDFYNVDRAGREMREKRDVLNRRVLIGLCRKIIQAGAPKAHQTVLLRNAVINKIDINGPLKRI
ncbi:hypothetical protein TNCV_4363981 [Trichonephila clavipes]|nr:hypothetical protein TNCV_4363981 [Trichonephila clavipes]